MEEIIKVIVKEPGKDPEYRVIKNDFHAMQEIVCGLIEAVHIADGTFFLCGDGALEFTSIPDYVTLSERR